MYNISTLNRSRQIIKSSNTQTTPRLSSSVSVFNSISPFNSPFAPVGYKNNFFRYLDFSTFCGVSVNEYSQHRRFVKSINRLNYLQYINFKFGRSSFLTLTISNDYIKSRKAIRNALERIERFLKRKGIPYYVIVKEIGGQTERLHYHLILFNAPKLSIPELRKIWRIGNIDIEEAYNANGGVYYLTAYIKKGLNLQWSRAFFKDKILRNDVYYMLHYDKVSGVVSPDKVFGVFITKSDYRDFNGKVSFDVVALEELRFFNYLKRLKGLKL